MQGTLAAFGDGMSSRAASTPTDPTAPRLRAALEEQRKFLESIEDPADRIRITGVVYEAVRQELNLWRQLRADAAHALVEAGEPKSGIARRTGLSRQRVQQLLREGAELT
jgi:hypothetical protein